MMKNNSACAKRKNTENLFLAILKMVVLEEDSRSFSEKIVSLVSSGIDWDYFLLLCLYHRVENLIYLGLKDCFANLPVDLVLKLKGYWLQSESMNQNNLVFLKEALADFRNLGVRVMPLKGLILAQMLYSKSNARGLLCDLDVLVPSSSRLQAEEGLRNKGYEIEGDTEPEGFQWQKDAIRIKDGLCIDLHWNLSRQWKDQAVLDQMWADGHEEDLGGISYLSLSLEDTLIYLCVHLADGDGFQLLIHICDIARFIHIFRDKINFNRLLDKARLYHLTNSLYYGFLLSQRIMEVPVKEGILSRLRPGIFKRIVMHPFVRRENLFNETFTRKLIHRYLGFFIFDILEAKKPGDYLRLLSLIISGPKKEDKFSPVNFSHRLFRPFNWLIHECFKCKANPKIDKAAGAINNAH
jgi:hypothetical protein